jgi:hypothetical protein
MREIEPSNMKVTISKALLLTLLLLPLLASGGSTSAATTTTSISCVPTTINVGQYTVCAITVSGWSGSVTGETVTITRLSGSGNIAQTSCALQSGGTCTVSVEGTAVGMPTIQAIYQGDNVNSFSSGSTTITVIQATTATYVNCVPSSVIVGIATVCIVTIGNGYSPSGSVSWVSNGQGQFAPASSCTLLSGTCFVNYTPSATASVQVTGTYEGDTNNFASSSSFTIAVSQSPSGTNVACSPQTVVVGLLTTCTATVTGYMPTGTVTWTVTGSGSFSSNTCTLSGSSTSTCQVTFTPQSISTVTAAYSGDSNNLGSFGTFQVNAIVNRYLQFTVDNSGPPATLTLTGCSVTPTSVVANGTAQIVHSDPGCGPITATLPSYTGGTRYVGPAGVNSFTIAGCSSGSCQVFAATIYYQLQNIYQATPYYPSSWTASGSVTAKGTWAGVNSTTICTIQLAGGGGQAVCQGWSDYKRPVSMSDLSVSSTQRWSTAQTAYADATANNFHNANYYFQFLEGFQYSLVGSVIAPSSPVLSYTAYGVGSSSTLQSSLIQVWLDSSSTWTAQQLLTGSTLGERWAASSNSGSVTAGQNVTVLYYHQFFETLGYTVVSGPSGSSPPAATLSVFGSQTRFQLSNQSVRQSTWADAGKTYNFTDPLGGSTATARWFAQNGAGTVTSSNALTPAYYYQYAFTLSFAVVGGGQNGPAQLNMTAFGSQGATPLTSTATTFWLDTGSPWGVSGLLPNSNASERWITTQQVSGTTTAATTIALQYYHQFLAKVQYQVLGGGSPVAPAFRYSASGTTTQSGLSTSQTSYWIDSGTTWHTPLYLNGTASGERWMATSVTSGLVTSAFSQGLSYKHQYFLKVAANTPLGGTFSNATNWYDSGSRVNLTALANGKWEFEFWSGTGPGSYNGTSIGPSLAVSGPITETAVYYPSVVITVSQGGSVSYVSGTVSGVVQQGASSTVYLPLGGNLTLNANPSSILQVFRAWSGNTTSKAERASLVLQGPANVTATFDLNTAGIAESAVASVAVVAAVLAYFFMRKKRINLRRRIPRRRESWLYLETAVPESFGLQFGLKNAFADGAWTR